MCFVILRGFWECFGVLFCFVYLFVGGLLDLFNFLFMFLLGGGIVVVLDCILVVMSFFFRLWLSLIFWIGIWYIRIGLEVGFFFDWVLLMFWFGLSEVSFLCVKLGGLCVFGVLWMGGCIVKERFGCLYVCGNG